MITYGRIEADVFCLCGRYRGIEQIKNYVLHIQKCLAEYDIDFEILPVFGIYIIENNKELVNDIYDKANLASKMCKGNYMQNFCVYEEYMSSDMIKEQVIVNNMKSALANEEFVLYLQPKYAIKNNTLKGAEVLVRWNAPKKGLIPPGEFIPVFEHNGFIMKLDYYVWEHTCILLKKWISEGKNVLPVSVNISRVEFVQS